VARLPGHQRVSNLTESPDNFHRPVWVRVR
jgi:hypothetical protein